MRCPYCGREVSDNAKACGYCGRWLAAGPPTPPPVAATPPKRGLPGWVIGLLIGLGALMVVVIAVAAVFVLPRLLSGGTSVADATPIPVTAGRIAFASDRDGNLEIYVMDADGHNVVRLTDNDAWDQYPVWSPDGNRIAFESERDGDLEIYVMDADGRNVVRLTDSDADDWSPAWSP